MQYTDYMPDPQKTPPEILFADALLAGTTPMSKGAPFDEIINRPRGMQGYIINLTVKGAGLVRDGDGSFICREGDLLLFPPHVPHYYHIAPGEQYWYHQWVYFFPRLYWLEALQWPTAISQVGKVSLPREHFAEMSTLFTEIIRRGGSQSHCSKLLQLNCLEQILLRRLELTQGDNLLLIDSRVSAAQLFIKQQLDSQNLNLESIAAMVNLSPSRLSHLFEKNLGMSPIKWRDKERISAAKLLLTTSALKIDEIALKVGIEDSNYFFRFFKKHVGLTPAQYRKAQMQPK